MKKLLLTFLVLLAILVLPTTSFSQTTQEVETQKRLNEVESKRATSSATTSSSTKNESLTFVEGFVTATNPSVLYISTDSGNKTIYANDSSKFINLDSKGKKLIGFGDLKIGETVMIVGVPREAAAGTATLVIRDQNAKPKYFSILGKFSEVKDTTVTLKNFSREDLPTSKFTLTTSSLIKKSGKNSTIDQLKQNDKVVVTGTIDDKGTLVASEIQVIN